MNYETSLNAIDELTELSQLRSFRHQFQQAFSQSKIRNNVILSYDVLNKMHDRIIKRTIQFAEKEMLGEGLGPPPSPYCYLLLGSGGRQEQTFGSDQDSALIYDSTLGDSDAKQQYFLTLANKVVSQLMELGYSPCDGKVQSNVLQWCKSVEMWKEQFKQWIEEADWESIRYLLVSADSRVIYGDITLHEQIMDSYEQHIMNSDYIFQRMIDNTVHHRIMVNVFGQLLTVKYGEFYGSIDIKYGAYIPFVNAIRWLAIKHNIKTTSTLERLEQLYIRKHITDDEYLQYKEVFIIFLSLRLLAGFSERNKYYESCNVIHPKRLDKEQVKKIKKSLQIGRKLQKHIQLFLRHSR